MKTNNKTGLAADIRKDAAIFMGVCAEENKYILLLHPTKDENIFAGLTIDKKQIVFEGNKQTMSLKSDILTILYEIEPKFSKLKVLTSTPDELGDDFKTIVGDYNKSMIENGIKVLPEKFVTKTLKDNGYDISGYTYHKQTFDNSHNLKLNYCDHGYDKYDKKILDIMTDVSKYENYIMEKQDEYDMLDAGCYLGLIAAGPAGTGKSTDPLIYCAKHKIPIIVFQCTQGTEEDTIIGKWQPKEGGGFEFVPGPLAESLENCWLLINEGNYSPAGVMSCLNSAMDDNGQILLPNGKVYHRGKNFRLVLTVNPGYKGTHLFNEATLNRFATVYYAPISKETLIERLAFESGYKNKQVLEVIADQFDKLRDLYVSHNLDTEVTFRNVTRFLRMILLKPEADIEKQFEIAFITNAIFGMDDIPSEFEEFKELTSPMLNDIKSILNQSKGVEDEVGTIKLEAHIGLDDLDDQLNAFAAEEGVELTEEEEA